MDVVAVSTCPARTSTLVIPTGRQDVGLDTTQTIVWVGFGQGVASARDHGKPIACRDAALHRCGLAIDDLRVQDGCLETITRISDQRDKQRGRSRISSAAFSRKTERDLRLSIAIWIWERDAKRIALWNAHGGTWRGNELDVSTHRFIRDKALEPRPCSAERTGVIPKSARVTVFDLRARVGWTLWDAHGWAELKRSTDARCMEHCSQGCCVRQSNLQAPLPRSSRVGVVGTPSLQSPRTDHPRSLCNKRNQPGTPLRNKSDLGSPVLDAV